VPADKIGWTLQVPDNASVMPCEEFEFRDDAVTLVTEVSMTDLSPSHQKQHYFFQVPRLRPFVVLIKKRIKIKVSMQHW
jgi:hypothetical protein